MEEQKKMIDPMDFEEDQHTPISPMSFDAPTKSVEEKTYIVLINDGGNEDRSTDGEFKICKGRTACFRFIENMVQSYGDEFDPFESKVITETKQTETKTGDTKYYLIGLEECISVYAFCKSVESFYGNYGFKIDEYYPTLKPESPEQDAESSKIAFEEQAVHRVYQQMIGHEIAPDESLHILKSEDDGEEVNV